MRGSSGRCVLHCAGSAETEDIEGSWSQPRHSLWLLHRPPGGQEVRVPSQLGGGRAPPPTCCGNVGICAPLQDALEGSSGVSELLEGCGGGMWICH